MLIVDSKNRSELSDFSETISRLDCKLMEHFASQLENQSSIYRSHVSFQSNKSRPIYRWYKFKEAFSASLIEYLFAKYSINRGHLMDPFAGSGTALYSAVEHGLAADGIELLPIGQQIINLRTIASKLKEEDVELLVRWVNEQPWGNAPATKKLNELRITRGAYPEQTKIAIEQYLSMAENENDRVKSVLIFALLCIIESVSYTRKDGQYLRWDYRSNRKQGTRPFDKGCILEFATAITEKLKQIIDDLKQNECGHLLWKTNTPKGEIKMHHGSCLNILPELQDNHYSIIVTSPPYCNRYDYTRTYALELALLGSTESDLVALRQEMLSCTVENRAKNLISMNSKWKEAIDICENEELLQAILCHLDINKQEGLLNNNGIPRMVRGYFYEMACVILECFRIMKKNSLLFMVNDNVRYAGVSISVDLILSHIAEQIGFLVENILVLPGSKGNSSQQMGEYGRQQLRKCVYVWRKK